MANFKRWQSEIGLEFVRWSLVEHNNFSEERRPSNSAAPRVFFNSNYLFSYVVFI